MIEYIVLLPLLGAIIAGFGGRFIGSQASELITSSLLVLSAIFSWIVFFSFDASAGTKSLELFKWLSSGNLDVSWSLRLDRLTAVMLVVVTSVSALVHVYSIGYMHHDPHRPRFFAYLSLFTFAMLMLVTADNFLQLFFGWEGVGLASYLLIGFWFQKDSANQAAMKAFIVNRVGDFGFALGIFAVFYLFGSIDFDTVFQAAQTQVGKTISIFGYNFDALTLCCLLLFMGAMGKSAQFLLHTWLPDAMEGPTPVSALIHAATMVTAGVFMVVRLSPLFELSPVALTVVTGFGAITAIFAATVGLTQTDIKRVIAYSTCSQLGYMFVAAGVGAYSIAIFHLFTHAFFKALLFLGAGSVIHAMSNEQDMRKMGGLWRLIPTTYIMMTIGTLALTGFPLTAGYFSKDAIIEAAYAAHNPLSHYAFWLLVGAAFLTSLYSWRLIFMTFHGRSRTTPEILSHVHESPPVMLVPLFLLAAGALLAGYLFKDSFLGVNYQAFWDKAIYLGTNNHILHELHNVPKWVVSSPFYVMVAGFISALIGYIFVPSLPSMLARLFKPIYLFFYNKWYFDEIYDFAFVKPTQAIARVLWKGGDMKIIDGFGPNGIAARVTDLSHLFRRFQSGYIYHYAFVMMIGLTALATYFFFRGGIAQ